MIIIQNGGSGVGAQCRSGGGPRSVFPIIIIIIINNNREIKNENRNTTPLHTKVVLVSVRSGERNPNSLVNADLLRHQN